MSELGDQESTQATPPEISDSTVESEASAKTSVEEFLINANTVVTRVKSLIQQGNLRQIVIKTEAGRPLLRIPCTVGVAGGTLGLLFAPLLMTSLAALGILAGRLTLVIEKSID